MPYNGSEEYSPANRWTLSTGRERRLNDLALQQAEEQRQALAQQGQHHADTVGSMYRGISEGIDKGMSGYRSGQEAGRAERRDEREGEAHVGNMALNKAQITGTEETTKTTRLGNDRTAMENAGRGGDYYTRMANADVAGSEEGVKLSSAQRRLAETQLSQIGKLTPAEQRAEGIASMNKSLELAEKYEAKGDIMNMEKMRNYAAIEGKKWGLDPTAIDVAQGTAQQTHLAGLKMAESSAPLLDSPKSGYVPSVERIGKLSGDANTALLAAKNLEDYDATLTGYGKEASDAKTEFTDKYPEKEAFVNELGMSTKTGRMLKVLRSKNQEIKVELAQLKGAVNAENINTLKPSITHLETLSAQLDQKIKDINNGTKAEPQSEESQYTDTAVITPPPPKNIVPAGYSGQQNQPPPPKGPPRVSAFRGQ